jgi:hypothetical protein
MVQATADSSAETRVNECLHFLERKRFKDLCETHAVVYAEMRKKSWRKRGLLPAEIEA